MIDAWVKGGYLSDAKEARWPSEILCARSYTKTTITVRKKVAPMRTSMPAVSIRSPLTCVLGSDQIAQTVADEIDGQYGD